MREVAKKHQERLGELKELVQDSESYFRDNAKRFYEFTDFVCNTSLTEEDINVLDNTGKPTIEFNILEAYVSRQRGEFAKQQPTLKVRAADGVTDELLTPNFVKLIEVVEQHLRAVFFDAHDDMLEYNVFSDLLIGGYSVLKVYTEYVNEMSFEQSIKVKRAFDPTLCGFDALARESHKGDGTFCFEMYPYLKEDFEKTYGSALTALMDFTGGNSDFQWSYMDGNQEIILLCDFYEKQKRVTEIQKLSNGHVIEAKYLEDIQKRWAIERPTEAMVKPVGQPRKTEITKIVRYRFCGNKVLQYDVTDFEMLPLVFVDGNSVVLKEGTATRQMTRPYVYHAKGIQKLKNFAGQCLGNELENMVQHKIIAAVEGVPENYQESYEDFQKSQVMLYHHFLDTNNPDVIIPPPREVARTPIPPEISNTFRMSDEISQAILGSYDASMGINNNQLSGRAIQEGAMMSNAAAMPYIVGYTKGLNRVAQIYINLLPKYVVTPRSVPILKPDGTRDYETINQKNSLYFKYDPKTLQVKVDTGVNFAVQKEMALKTIREMMATSEIFAQFINVKGLNVILDNIDIRGIEDLKLKAKEFEKEIEQQQQQQQQAQQQGMQMQQEAVMAELQKKKAEAAKEMREAQAPVDGELKAAELQRKAQVDEANLALKQEENEFKFLDILSGIKQEEAQLEIQQAKIDAENARTSVEAAVSVSSHIHDMEMALKQPDKPEQK
jgi:hypothetical protein